MKEPSKTQERFTGLALFISGAGLLYASFVHFPLLEGAPSQLTYAWFVLSGLVLLGASMLYAARRHEGSVMKILVYGFLMISVPVIVIAFLLP